MDPALKNIINKIQAVIGILVIIFILLLVFKFFVIINPGHRGVVFNQITGVEKRQLGEGFHLLIPFIQQVTVYDVKLHTYTMSASHEDKTSGDDSISGLTADGQLVSVDVSVMTYLDKDNVWRLHQEIGKDYVNLVIRPEARNMVRMAIAGYSAEQLYSGSREKVQQEMFNILKEPLARKYIILDGVLLRHIEFSKDFQHAIEQKQIAAQQRDQMKYIVEKAKLEMEQKIIQARAESTAIYMKSQALAQNPMLIQYEYIQKVSPNIQAIITDGKSIMNLGR